MCTLMSSIFFQLKDVIDQLFTNKYVCVLVFYIIKMKISWLIFVFFAYTHNNCYKDERKKLILLSVVVDKSSDRFYQTWLVVTNVSFIFFLIILLILIWSRWTTNMVFINRFNPKRFRVLFFLCLFSNYKVCYE